MSTIYTKATTPKPITAQFSSNIHNQIGTRGTATIEPSEEIPEIKTVAPQIAKVINPTRGLSANSTPIPVAEDFPPLKPM